MGKRGASQLALRRQIMGYTQKELSSLVGATHGYICAVERRRLVPGAGLKGRLLQILGGKEEDFFDPETGLAL